MTAQQAGLLAKARRSIRSARLLLTDGDYDTAVSRAYYAMFYVAEALLLARGLAFSKHSAVIGAFGKEFARTGAVPAEFHVYLIEAAGERNISDYQVVSRLTPDAASQHIDRAERLLSVGEQFLARSAGTDA